MEAFFCHIKKNTHILYFGKSLILVTIMIYEILSHKYEVKI